MQDYILPHIICKWYCLHHQSCYFSLKHCVYYTFYYSILEIYFPWIHRVLSFFYEGLIRDRFLLNFQFNYALKFTWLLEVT